MSKFQIEYMRVLSQQLFRNDPYEWQLNGAQSVLNGHDTVVIQKTGGGKSWMFIMAYFAWLNRNKTATRRTILIVCPLVALIEDQMGL